MSAKVSIVDRGLGKLRDDLKTLRRLVIHAGLQPPESEKPHGDSGKTVGFIAGAMEYGTPTIPARPFLRHTHEVAADRNRDRLRKAVSDVVDGRAEPEDAMAVVGKAFAAEIVDTIDRSQEWAKPLAASTVRAKGHSVPLIETQLMRDSVTYTVVDGSSVVRRGEP